VIVLALILKSKDSYLSWKSSVKLTCYKYNDAFNETIPLSVADSFSGDKFLKNT